MNESIKKVHERIEDKLVDIEDLRSELKFASRNMVLAKQQVQSTVDRVKEQEGRNRTQISKLNSSFEQVLQIFHLSFALEPAENSNLSKTHLDRLVKQRFNLYDALKEATSRFDHTHSDYENRSDNILQKMGDALAAKVKRNRTAQPYTNLPETKHRISTIEDLNEISEDEEVGKKRPTLNEGPSSQVKFKSGTLATPNQGGSQLTSPSSMANLETAGSIRVRHSMERIASAVKHKMFMSHTKSNGFASQKLLNEPSVLNSEEQDVK